MRWCLWATSSLAAVSAALAAAPKLKKPPLGFSSWNHFGKRTGPLELHTVSTLSAFVADGAPGDCVRAAAGMGVSAPLLLDVADAFVAAGLRDAGCEFM